jgi:hypothetical protein
VQVIFLQKAFASTAEGPAFSRAFFSVLLGPTVRAAGARRQATKVVGDCPTITHFDDTYRRSQRFT